MALPDGHQLGPYEITGLLGQGGMGEVYRARDRKLKREVAIKVLPEAFTADPARMARFQREAEVLASLDHPNIGAIYGFVETEGVRALVLTLIDGPALDERIASGAIPLEESLAIARQIIAAVEYAHERGVIHRDLKPANVKITPEGVVKVLDFGLAKVMDESQAEACATGDSPTLTLGHTRAGVILGTAAYMSPEQAVGKPADRRSDIFSFGAVLYEMLTGTRAFTGDSAPEILVSVAKDDPDWSKLPASTPRAVRELLQRCLTKDRRQRLQAIGEARILLSGPLEDAPATAPSRSRLGFGVRAAIGAALAALAILAGVALWAPWRAPAPALEVFRYQLSLPPNSVGTETASAPVSPDGRKVALVASPANGLPRIWIRDLDSLSEFRPLAGTEGIIYPIFWSFDSRWVVFSLDGKLMKVDIAGGTPVTICDLNGLVPVSGSENASGTILFGTSGDAIWQVPSVGGALKAVTRLNRGEETAHNHPRFLPDGRHFLYFRRFNAADKIGMYAGDLQAAPEQQSAQPLIVNQTAAQYAPARGTHPGFVLFVRDGNLFAQRFDADGLKLTGDPVRVADQVGTFLDGASFSVAGNGVLIYRAGSSNAFQLAWFDRQGNRTGVVGSPVGLGFVPALSPLETHAIVSRVVSGAVADLWRIDLERNNETQLTVHPAAEWTPVWSPDGKEFAFSSNRDGTFDLYRKDADGAKDETLLLKSEEHKEPTSWSRDGRFLLYMSVNPQTGPDIGVLRMDDPEKRATLLGTPAAERWARFSPNMRWMAYTSDESGGAAQIFVRELLPDRGNALFRLGPPQIISRNGGTMAAWRGDGKELFFQTPDGSIMAAAMGGGDRASGPLDPGEPARLFQQPILVPEAPTWTVSRDGQRFLVVSTAQQDAPAPFNVVVNWQESLRSTGF